MELKFFLKVVSLMQQIRQVIVLLKAKSSVMICIHKGSKWRLHVNTIILVFPVYTVNTSTLGFSSQIFLI